MKRPTIVVVGSVNTDLTVQASRVARPGETLLGRDFSVSHGGKGANQAVAAARLGASVTFVGCVGCDTFGDNAVAALAAEGIDTRFIRRDVDCPSGVALIVVGDDGENSIIVAPGSNATLSTHDVEAAADVFRIADVVLTQLEVPIVTVEKTLCVGRSNGAITILNPAPAQRLPQSVFDLTDWLTPNETEAALLTGVENENPGEFASVGNRLIESGVGNVVVTRGSAGATYVSTQEMSEVESFHVDAIDTVGAGDAFNGALAVALGSGFTVPEAMRFASAAAAISVTRRGAQASMPMIDEVERLMRNGTA
ncbi:MAG TPA: ribokinase [Firmicutes bacterium]|nr:ribokinase [Bacillota bacterium]